MWTHRTRTITHQTIFIQTLNKRCRVLIFHVWCVMSGFRILKLFFHQTFNFHRHVHNYSNPFVNQLTEEEWLYRCFQHDKTTAQTSYATLTPALEAFKVKGIVSRGKISWTSRYLDFSAYHFIYEETWRIRCTKIIRTDKSKQRNAENTLAAISQAELVLVLRTLW